MTEDNIDRCLAVIDAKLRFVPLKREADGSMPYNMMQLYTAVLAPMLDDLGMQAVANICSDHEGPPDPAVIKHEYARILGCGATGETPTEFLARKRNEADMTVRLREDHARRLEEGGRYLRAELERTGMTLEEYQIAMMPRMEAFLHSMPKGELAESSVT